MWIWYPASVGRQPASAAEYLPPKWRLAVERQRGVLITKLLTRDLSRVRTHSVHDADVSLRHRVYPVILMRAGLAALSADYTTVAEDLASHGYVVVGFDAPYRSSVVVFPDGRVISRAAQNDAELVGGPRQEQLIRRLVRAWSADVGFVLDQLELMNTSGPSGRFRGRLDLARVGVLGHSLGGATALMFCADDARCKAGVNVDGAPYGSVISSGVTQPFMFLLSDRTGKSNAQDRRIAANIRAIYDRLPRQHRIGIVIRGANHFGFSDDGSTLKSPILRNALRALGFLGLDGRRQLTVATHCIRTFFDAYLNGTSTARFRARQAFPEIEYFEDRDPGGLQ